MRTVESATTAATLNLSVDCQSGEVATGGGYAAFGGGTDVHVSVNEPSVDGSTPSAGSTNEVPDGWRIFASNAGSNTITYQVYVICASP